jgi:hypothetical protein
LSSTPVGGAEQRPDITAIAVVAGVRSEAPTGIEPVYTALQAAA